MTEPYQDPDDPRNGPAYHTGKLCIEGCGRPAGTKWSRLWCFPCNVARMDQVEAQFNKLEDMLARKVADPGAGEGA